MIIVRVELHSANTGKVTEIARMGISNIGGTEKRGNYRASTWRGRTAEHLARRIAQRDAVVTNYPRLTIHVWHLVARALMAMGYAGQAETIQQVEMFDAQ